MDEQTDKLMYWVALCATNKIKHIAILIAHSKMAFNQLNTRKLVLLWNDQTRSRLITIWYDLVKTKLNLGTNTYLFYLNLSSRQSKIKQIEIILVFYYE